MDYGALRVVRTPAFIGETATREELLAAYDGDPLPTQTVSGWPRIHVAIHRGDLFIVEATLHDFSATLRFCPTRPTIGDYQIRSREGTETGVIVKVQEIPSNETDRRLTMLLRFPHRYYVGTLANDRARTSKRWLVGVTEFRIVEEDVASE